MIEADLTVMRKVALPGSRFGRSKPWGSSTTELAEDDFLTLGLCAALIWSDGMEPGKPPIGLRLVQEQFKNALR